MNEFWDTLPALGKYLILIMLLLAPAAILSRIVSRGYAPRPLTGARL